MCRRCVFVLLLWLTVACDTQLDEYGTVSFNVEEFTGVRSSAGLTEEAIIKNISYFLFDSDTGYLVRYVTSMSRQVTMSGIPYGNMVVYAVANVDMETFKEVRSIRDLKQTHVHHYLSAFNEFLPMRATAEFVLDASLKTVHLSLERYMSRLQLVRVSNRLDGLLDGEGIILKHAFLTNVQGGFHVDMKANSAFWYSKYGRYDFSPSETSYITSEDQLITGFHTFRDIGDLSLSPGEDISLEALMPFYAFPNYTLSDENGWQPGGFTERCTRIVLVAEIMGTEYYYPVNLLNMASNHSYDISYTISRLGSDDPDTFGLVEVQDNLIDFEEMEDGGEIEIKF